MMSEKRFIVFGAFVGGYESEPHRAGWTLFGAYDTADLAKERAKKLQNRLRKEFSEIYPTADKMKLSKVEELEVAGKLFVLWDPEENEPYHQGECGEMECGFLCYGVSRIVADNLALNIIDTTIGGELEDLSNSPTELGNFIESSPALKIPKGKAEIKITKRHAAEIMPKLNSLLKKPLYEVKELGIGEVQEWENKYEMVRIELGSM